MSSSPVVGISAGSGDMAITEGVLPSYYVGAGYVRAVADAAGLPILLPAPQGHEERAAREALEIVDAVVLSGGNDIAPETYGGDPETDVDKVDRSRDVFEVALVRGARERGLPVLGVCRGMELINVAYGGTLRGGVRHEAADDAALPGLRDARAHVISLTPESRVAHVIGREDVEAICLHHQATDRIGDGLRVTGAASDGIAEVVEDPDGWIIGVLWHPEQALDRTPIQRRLYESLVHAAAQGVRA